MVNDLQYFLDQFLKHPSALSEEKLRTLMDAIIEYRKVRYEQESKI